MQIRLFLSHAFLVYVFTILLKNSDILYIILTTMEAGGNAELRNTYKQSNVYYFIIIKHIESILDI